MHSPDLFIQGDPPLGVRRDHVFWDQAKKAESLIKSLRSATIPPPLVVLSALTRFRNDTAEGRERA